MAQRLLSNAKAPPDGVYWSSSVVAPDDKERLLFVFGSFADASVLVEISPNGRDWFQFCEPITGKAWIRVKLSPSAMLRTGIRGGTSKTDVSSEYV